MLSKATNFLLFSHVVSAGKCPFGYGSSDEPAADAESANVGQPKRRLEGVKYPADLLTCPSDVTKVLKTVPDFTETEYEAVVESVNELYDDATDRNEFAGCVVRLAGHDLMDFRYENGTQKNGKLSNSPINMSGGSDGCINFEDADNKGLTQCIDKIKLQEAYAEHCGIVSLADFIVIAAEAVMGRTAMSYDDENEFGEKTLARAFRDNFQSGRETVESCDWNKGLMPDPEEGCDDVMDLFGNHIFRFEQGRTKKTLAAAILGAHTLGSAKLENSGYEGSWSSKGSEGFFDNDYYIQMLTRGWGPDLAVGGDSLKNQWKIVDGGATDRPQMMLNSDLCFAYDNNLLHSACMSENNFNNQKCKKLQNQGTSLNATAGNCCAWTHKNALFNRGVFDQDGTGNLCGQEIKKKEKESMFQPMREQCCTNLGADSSGDCDSSAWPKGKAFSQVLDFAADEDKWLESYVKAWKIATENGHMDLKPLSHVIEEDGDVPYKCAKLKTRKLCETDDNCSFQLTDQKNERGMRVRKCMFGEDPEVVAKELAKAERQAETQRNKEEREAEKQRIKEEKERKKAERQARQEQMKIDREERRLRKQNKKNPNNKRLLEEDNEFIPII